MPQFHNTSPDTVVDALTGRIAGPDEVIDVPDDLVEHFEDLLERTDVDEAGKETEVRVPHPIWARVTAPPPAPTAPVVPTPPTPAADAAGITSQEA